MLMLTHSLGYLHYLFHYTSIHCNTIHCKLHCCPGMPIRDAVLLAVIHTVRIRRRGHYTSALNTCIEKQMLFCYGEVSEELVVQCIAPRYIISSQEVNTSPDTNPHSICLVLDLNRRPFVSQAKSPKTELLPP